MIYNNIIDSYYYCCSWIALYRYCHFSDSIFINEINTVLTELRQADDATIVFGDIHIDLLSDDITTNERICMMDSNGFVSCILYHELFLIFD